jgi:hypothetical protein
MSSSSSSSTTTDNQEQIMTETETTPSEITDLELRKRNDETFDTEDDDSDSQEEAEEDDEEASYVEEGQDAAADILDELVELFIERNGRDPNEEEVMQWIEVLKSLKIEDGGENDDAQPEGRDDLAEAPVVNAAAE